MHSSYMINPHKFDSDVVGPLINSVHFYMILRSVYFHNYNLRIGTFGQIAKKGVIALYMSHEDKVNHRMDKQQFAESNE